MWLLIVSSWVPAVAASGPDSDGDGVPDAVDACVGDPAQGPFGPRRVIASWEGAADVVAPYTVVDRLVAEDLDGDGLVDLAVARPVRIDVLWRTGPATFAEAVAVGLTPSPSFLRAVDVDGDGDLDLLLVSAGVVGWFENLGGGAFEPVPVLVTTSPDALWLDDADVDRDGAVDLLVTTPDEGVPYLENVTVYRNDGAGGFTASQAGIRSHASVVAGDLDGDGDLDAVTGESGELGWLENAGDGTFAGVAGTTTVSPGGAPTLADLDGDGVDEVIVARSGAEPGLQIVREQGGNLVVAEERSAGVDVDLVVSRAVDVDGDGELDVLASGAGSWRSDAVVLFRDSDVREFGPGAAGANLYDVVTTDLDGDGDAEAITLEGSATLTEVAWYDGGPEPADTDGDGICDADDPCDGPDADGDGLCAELDCDDADPAVAGAPCPCDAEVDDCAPPADKELRKSCGCTLGEGSGSAALALLVAVAACRRRRTTRHGGGG